MNKPSIDEEFEKAFTEATGATFVDVTLRWTKDIIEKVLSSHQEGLIKEVGRLISGKKGSDYNKGVLDSINVIKKGNIR